MLPPVSFCFPQGFARVFRSGVWVAGLLFLASGAAANDAKSAKSAPAVPVIVSEVTKEPVDVTLTLLGELKAKDAIMLTATVTETIDRIHFEDGQMVKKGDLLVSLRDREEEARVLEAQATVREARAQYERAKEVEGRGNVTQALVDERYREWQTAQARLTVAEAQLADRQLTAPFDGRLGLKRISEGALVQVGTEIVSIQNIAQLDLDLLIPERYLSSVFKGQSVAIQSLSYPNTPFQGEVFALSPEMDAVSRMLPVRARVNNNRDQLLKSAMMVEATLALTTAEQIRIPNSAVLMQGDFTTVYRLKPDRDFETGEAYEVERVRIETGQRGSETIEVLSGLSPGDVIIAQGVMGASVRKPVRIKDWQTPESSQRVLLKGDPVATPENTKTDTQTEGQR
ncbi:MAG: efflux RND transporter periplasmic adaptor subunit [Hydrogenovibrio sp.]|uniref:efflux RND transporter periplasmic adaptor subunit n=1 Tax=Hydrogenovibrio sp. TaxID=2065821 RepID=UPI00286FE31D|nr:efflux RND transporter periplasmic adaptor subunit [Hydrogenovibrio sp.]MDR9499379.1 efflux RND transporter periplasmic adaptor subunit [Hydrogenovibrio sp.]